MSQEDAHFDKVMGPSRSDSRSCIALLSLIALRRVFYSKCRIPTTTASTWFDMPWYGNIKCVQRKTDTMTKLSWKVMRRQVLLSVAFVIIKDNVQKRCHKLPVQWASLGPEAAAILNTAQFEITYLVDLVYNVWYHRICECIVNC